MKRVFLCLVLLLTLSLNVTAQSCDWNELIGKKLVLYRYGRMMDGVFTDYKFTDPVGQKPMEQLTVIDDSHFEWMYTLSGDFKQDCKVDGKMLTFEPPFFHNRFLNYVKRIGNVVITDGHDGITRTFYIEEPPTDEAMPLSCNSKKGFCDGKLDDLIPKFYDFTYNTTTPMGRHFVCSLPSDDGIKELLESKEDAFAGWVANLKTVDVTLYPNGEPIMTDVGQKHTMMDYNGAAALAEMAYLYPEFIKSIIHQESPEIFCVDMFDPMGKPIKVRVTNRFMLNREGGHVFNVGKDGEPNWVAILEKAVMKWISAYQHLTGLAFCNSEWIVPMFTGDGRSFCIRPGQLSLKDLARVVNTCLDYGLIVEGIEWIKKENSEEVAGKLYGNSVLPPQKAGALFSMRNNAVSDDVADLRNIMPDEEKDPPLIGLRINSPGVAAKFFKKADSRK